MTDHHGQLESDQGEADDDERRPEEGTAVSPDLSGHDHVSRSPDDEIHLGSSGKAVPKER